jgi:excisionase family DNA binding protein
MGALEAGAFVTLIPVMEDNMANLRLIAGGELATEIATRTSNLQRRCAELNDEIGELAGLVAQQASTPAPTAVLTVEECAHELRVSRSTVFALLRSGSLRSFREGRRRLVARADLEAHIRMAGEAR